MDGRYKEQLKEHLKFLMDELTRAYRDCDFDEYDRLKKQIYHLKEMMNSVDKFISERQTLVKLEGLEL
jgi:hypothetical protein